MSLNFRLDNINNHTELLKENGQPRVVTEALIFATMAVGFNTITEKNHEEFFVRLHTVESVGHPYLLHFEKEGDPPNPQRLTLEDVKRHIGLSTNATTLTRPRFNKNIAAMCYVKSYDELRLQRGQLEGKETEAASG